MAAQTRKPTLAEQLPFVVTIPGAFAADHFDRCGLEQIGGGQAFVLARGPRWVVRVNASALAKLRSDAAFYANLAAHHALPSGLRTSAKRTVAALAKVG